MKVTVETSSYNFRRYGKPWIARVDFSCDAQGEFSWGEWCGQQGDEGLLVVDAEAGDVIAHGQKDLRSNKTKCDYFSVEPDGSLTKFASKSEAYQYFQQQVSSASDPRGDALVEIRRLMLAHGISTSDLA